MHASPARCPLPLIGAALAVVSLQAQEGGTLPAKVPEAVPPKEEAVSFAAESRSVALSRTPARVRVFLADDIERSGARTLGEFLAQVLPSDTRNLGGTGLTGHSFQGAARPQDTVILLDGLRMSDPSRGAADLNAIPLVGVTRVEVLTGPLEARTGGGATGGVIALFTGPPSKGGSSGSLAGAGGNGGAARGEATPGFAWNGGWFKAGVVSAQEEQATETTRPYRLDAAYLGFAHRSGRATWSFALRGHSQTVPDPYQVASAAGRVYDAERESRLKSFSGNLGLRWELAQGRTFELNAASGRLRWEQPPAGAAGLERREGTQQQLTAAWHQDGARGGWSLLVDALREESRQPSGAFQDRADATRLGLALEGRVDLGTRTRLVLNARESFDRISLEKPGLAGDAPSRKNAFAWRTGLTFRVSDAVHAFAALGQGAAHPSLPQSLAAAPGDPLRPERTRFASFGLAVSGGLAFARLEAGETRVDDARSALGEGGIPSLALPGTLALQCAEDHPAGSIGGPRLRFRSVELSGGVGKGRLLSAEAFVRRQQARDEEAPDPFQTLQVEGRPGTTWGLKTGLGGTRASFDVRWTTIGSSYEFLRAYGCGELEPLIVEGPRYRDLSTTLRLQLGKRFRLYVRGEHLLQPKVDAAEWLRRSQDGLADGARAYGYPAPPPKVSVELRTSW